MAAVQYYDVILKPVITEKSMAGMSEKKYTFLVHPEASAHMRPIQEAPIILRSIMWMCGQRIMERRKDLQEYWI